jgi:hypothetical protein
MHNEKGNRENVEDKVHHILLVHYQQNNQFLEYAFIYCVSMSLISIIAIHNSSKVFVNK